MMQIAQVPGASLLFAQITRADGTVERQRLVAFSHPNPLIDDEQAAAMVKDGKGASL